MSAIIDIYSERKVQLIDITSEIESLVKNSQIKNGIRIIYVPHTTAGVLINENADPSVASDIEKALKRIVPPISFEHIEGNSPAHFLSSLVGCSLSIPIINGSLQLGRWQGIFFSEFDGPRRRKVIVTMLSSSS